MEEEGVRGSLVGVVVGGTHDGGGKEYERMEERRKREEKIKG